MQINFSTENTSLATIGTYISLIMTLNYILYFFINGFRQYKSQQSKYRAMYFFCIPLFLTIIYGFFRQLNMIINDNVDFSIKNSLIIVFYIISIYAIITDTYYQFWRKNWLSNEIDNVTKEEI